MKVAFDVDGTLIHQEGIKLDTPRYDVIQFLFFLKQVCGAEVFVWSGGGVQYAERWVQKLGLEHEVKVVGKGSFVPDLAVDDLDVSLGTINLRVGVAP